MIDAEAAPTPGTAAADAPAVGALAWLGGLAASPAAHRVRVPEFLALSLQLGLLLFVASTFGIEEGHRFGTLLPVVFGGFVVNCWLPLAWRPAFQALLTMGSALLLFGVADGALLVGIGLGLVGLCHLPVAFWWRVAAVVVAGAGLALVRVGRVTTEWGPVLLPILGAIFMFRLVVYLYDLRNERDDVSPWHRLGYFFMLPNVCFPLFPIVDWTTFRKGYYARGALATYQKGIGLVLRGITHLLLYRVVYAWVAPSPAEVVDLNSLALFLVSSWGLYLRISGLFHLIAGILALYGYDLPPTHDRYFLASGFSDLWRRANIYWKDFMTKVFYLPFVMRVQHLGMARALVVTMIPLFVVTWLLHSWQWFWIRGVFPVRLIDGIFWMTFGVLVLVNSLLQLRRGRARKLGRPRWSFGRALVHSVKVVAMFLTMCVGWSFFISPTIADWLALLAVGANASTTDVARIVAIVLGTVAAGVGAQWVAARWEGGAALARVRSSGWTVAAAAVALLLPTLPAAEPVMGVQAAGFMTSLRSFGVNEGDQELIDRGYYETLMEPPSFASTVWEVEREKPRGWGNWRRAGGVRPSGDFLVEEFIPSAEVVFKDRLLTINRWGMRDRDYEMARPPDTWRGALIGGSFAMGSGVADGEPFEALVERRLNARPPRGAQETYEILNFSKGGRKLAQKLFLLETRVLPFEPTAVLWEAAGNEAAPAQLADMLDDGWTPYDELNEMLRGVGAEPGMSLGDLRPRLRQISDELTRWVYHRVVALCRERGVIPVWVYYPTVTGDDPAPRQAWRAVGPGLAREAGFVVIEMADVFDGYGPEDLAVAPWDMHPNALGHRLLADRFHQELLANAAAVGIVTGEENRR